MPSWMVTAGAYLCFAYGIQRLQASEASVLCSIEPAFGLVFAWLLLDEGISVQKLVGAAVIVASCILVAVGDTGADEQGAPVDWTTVEGGMVV